MGWLMRAASRSFFRAAGNSAAHAPCVCCRNIDDKFATIVWQGVTPSSGALVRIGDKNNGEQRQ